MGQVFPTPRVKPIKERFKPIKERFWVIYRDHTFLRVAEFQAESQNLPFATEFDVH